MAPVFGISLPDAGSRQLSVLMTLSLALILLTELLDRPHHLQDIFYGLGM